MLEATSLRAGYGPVEVLHDVSLTVRPGEITCLLGRNGAGKTSTLKALMGLLPLTSGTVTLDGKTLHDLPAHEIPKLGIGYVPQGRRLFKELTVSETIEVGLMTRGEGRETRDWVLGLFPRLRERLSQQAGTLSGGEQQMLATARALCLRPKVLLLDEPTEGLQPSMIDLIRDVTVKMRDEGYAILLVEQRMDAILDLADRAVFLETGRSVETADAATLRANPDLLHRRLGV
jgi:branched-chain amino acid transport system ATP-binding protein